jgi:hypothetical protein
MIFDKEQSHPLYAIDRALVIVRPRQPYVDWANKLPDASFKISLKELRKEGHVFLIDTYETLEEAQEIIEDIWEDIFDHCLFAWCTEAKWWPQKRSFKIFQEWFDLEFHDTVIDPYDGEIYKELF